MRKYLYIAAIAALFVGVPAQAQQPPITKPVILTMEADTFDMFKLYIASMDNDAATVLETDITQAAAMTWIQGQMGALLRHLQDNAMDYALRNGRRDLVPNIITNGASSLDAARIAQQALEHGSTGVN